MDESLHIVVPGEVIVATSQQDFLRGHGTYLEGEGGDTRLRAAVAGVVERVNKLISVRPPNTRYIGEVGDLVVGRVVEVAAKRWRIEINSHQHGVLMLSSVNLPGGAQRRRTHEDQLQMRNFFVEGDLISAEVQSILGDGAISLHTRSNKYGRLENGQLIVVPPTLIKRVKQHFLSLPCGIDVALGNNGYIWLSATPPPAIRERFEQSDDRVAMQQELAALETPPEVRRRICRVHNAIALLRQRHRAISPDSIMEVYEASIAEGKSASEMLRR